MDFAALRTLIETHPTHAATSDVDMITWLTDPTAVARDKTHLPNSEIQDIALAETTEWNALTDPERVSSLTFAVAVRARTYKAAA